MFGCLVKLLVFYICVGMCLYEGGYFICLMVEDCVGVFVSIVMCMVENKILFELIV